MVTNAAFAILSATVLLGLGLAIPRLGATTLFPAFVARLGLAHGLIGGAGLLLLLGGLLGGGSSPSGQLRGGGLFGWDATGLLVIALVAGLVIYVRVRRGRGVEALLVLRGSLAVIGYVMLAAFISSG